MKSEERANLKTGSAQGFPAPARRSVSQKQAAVNYLRSHYAELKRDAGVARLSSVDQWLILTDIVTPHDATVAGRLKEWSALDMADVLHQLAGPSRENSTKLWTYRRELVCWLVDDSAGCELVVDANDTRHLFERFADRANALRCADELKQRLRATKKWKEETTE